MSGNHLLPIYYNTSRLTPKRKKKKVSEKELKSRLEHEKFIMRMGYKKDLKPMKITQVEKPIPPLSISKPDVSKWEPCTKKSAKSILSGNYVIGQAYNKGNLVVLSKSESSESSTGKRR